MKDEIWTPDFFIKNFGEEKIDLINCLTGKTVSDEEKPMQKFMDGFKTGCVKDKNGQPMIFKMKVTFLRLLF